MQRTAPQTTTEPNERISQSQDEHYPMMWWNHEVNKQNAALYEEGREEESEGSSMPSHSVTNEENLAGDASDMWYSPPSDHRVSQFAHLDVISFALGKGSLPTRQSSTYTRSGETPENQLIVPFARGSLPFESAFWQRSVFNGAGTATPQSGMNEALSRITPFYMKSVSRPKSPQSWIEWGVDDGSTLLQKQYIPRERVESANSANAQQFEPNNAMRNVADDFGKGVSEAEQIGNSWYPGNQKRTLVIPSNNNAENLFSSESVPHSDDHMHTSVRNPQNEIAKQALADHSQWCCQWALDGLCERNWQRIRQLCPKSCGSIVCSSIGQTQSCNRVIDVDVVDCFQQQRFGVYDSKNFQSNVRYLSQPFLSSSI
ncbi:hypothetical protein Tcan_05573 [Toxocara canis]|uniref:ShKT domain-containing protein n=1 Tax=Toxocara canis TaxID=6265 RepID=A0A0B2VWX5_TOXCA|nr:hypothetical protein Tcan_05573 [Toxocara canis]